MRNTHSLFFYVEMWECGFCVLNFIKIANIKITISSLLPFVNRRFTPSS